MTDLKAAMTGLKIAITGLRVAIRVRSRTKKLELRADF
jgi:hypothetical protein